MTAANEGAADKRAETGWEAGWAAAEPTWAAPGPTSGERSEQLGEDLKSSDAYFPQLPPASYSPQLPPSTNWTQHPQSAVGWPYQAQSASPYQAPGYLAPGGYGYDRGGYASPAYGNPAAGRTNGFAIAAFVCAFFVSVLGVIFGFVALSQIKRTGEGGRGLAIAGIVISIAGMVFFLIFLITLIAAAGSIHSSYGSLSPAGGVAPVVSHLGAPAATS